MCNRDITMDEGEIEFFNVEIGVLKLIYLLLHFFF